MLRNKHVGQIVKIFSRFLILLCAQTDYTAAINFLNNNLLIAIGVTKEMKSVFQHNNKQLIINK